ncbi:MAG: type III pantothenate kinase [Lachnospiraceae bacterium]|nr:type III pantothenate kinase [Lachnospiraceae bacterium]MDN4743962.1 type III pantothenate kinase [Lachnospiraceae bacterium C1.1]
MILAIDMGNTNIEVGCIDGDNIVFTERLSTDNRKTEMEYAVLLKTAFELHNCDLKSVTGGIISSVVPPLTHIIKQAVRMLFHFSPMVVGAGIKTGLNIKMDNPAMVGADLVVDSVAGMYEYGAPLIIIDMGTATTITALDKSSSYIGGVIIPGLRVSLESLVSQTSQLPRVSLGTPKKCIGKNTVDCMKSGLIYGEAARIDGMIDRFFEELGCETKIVATGGLSKIIIPNCHHDIILDSDLMLKGLKHIYEKNVRAK